MIKHPEKNMGPGDSLAMLVIGAILSFIVLAPAGALFALATHQSVRDVVTMAGAASWIIGAALTANTIHREMKGMKS